MGLFCGSGDFAEFGLPGLAWFCSVWRQREGGTRAGKNEVPAQSAARHTAPSLSKAADLNGRSGHCAAPCQQAQHRALPTSRQGVGSQRDYRLAHGIRKPAQAAFRKRRRRCDVSQRRTSCHAKRRLAFFLFDVNGCRRLTHRGSDLDQQGNRPGCRARRYHCIDLK